MVEEKGKSAKLYCIQCVYQTFIFTMIITIWRRSRRNNITIIIWFVCILHDSHEITQYTVNNGETWIFQQLNTMLTYLPTFWPVQNNIMVLFGLLLENTTYFRLYKYVLSCFYSLSIFYFSYTVIKWNVESSMKHVWLAIITTVNWKFDTEW